MKFNSWSYLLLLLIAVPIYYRLPKNVRIVFCAAVSFFFYAMWRWDFGLLMLFSAVVDYFAARQIAATEKHSKRLSWLLVSLIINLGLLMFFKYTYFIDDQIKTVTSWFGIAYHGINDSGLKIILPLGISFYTFQTISYTIDVYRKVIPPTKNFMLFVSYVIFWPQLIAGPILRAKEVIPQFLVKPRLLPENIQFGLTKIILGLFKKVILADNIAPFVDQAFGLDPGYLQAPDVWIATILFGFQIYFDFSGYSDIAIGSARLMGFHFPENFDWPYLATSPREFWKRWHISLSSWIRDYLYLPIMGKKYHTDSTGGIDIEPGGSGGGKKKKTNEGRSTFALFATWVIMGFWHGAGWNFGLWGFYHALCVYLYRKIRILKTISVKAPIASGVVTFFVMMASWIPFRAHSMDQTLGLFKAILNPFRYHITGHQLHLRAYLFAFVLLFGMIVAKGIKTLFTKYPKSIVLHLIPRYAGIAALVFLIIVYMETVVQFIYFQF